MGPPNYWAIVDVSGPLEAPKTRVRFTDHRHSEESPDGAALDHWLADRLSELNREFGPGNAAMPVFVRVPRSLAHRWADITDSVLRLALRGLPLQPVQLPHGDRSAPRPYRPPRSLCALGLSSGHIVSSEWFASFRRAPAWGSEGLRVDEFPLPLDTDLLRRCEPDILLGDERNLLATLPALFRVPEATRPRLLVAYGAQHFAREDIEIPARTAVLWLEPEVAAAEAFLRVFLERLTQDRSLSEAFAVALFSMHSFWEKLARLVADPESNQGFRMFAGQKAGPISSMEGTLPHPFMLPDDWLGPFSEPPRPSPDTWDYVDYHYAANKIPTYWEAKAARPGRRVDLRLERPSDAGWLGPRQALRRGASYRLRLQIGLPLQGSLLKAPPPPIDPLLPTPPPAGHALQAVLYPMDFELAGPELQSLMLPLTGASEPVFFDVRAPEKTGVARMRAVLYWRNHMVQSFVISAEIAGEEAERKAPVLQGELEFARSATLNNLDALGARALCIGVNQDPDSATHTLMLKGEKAGSFHFTEALLAEQVPRFRELLKRASLNERNLPRFPDFPAPGQPLSADFHEVVRQMADWGGEMFQALFTRAPAPVQDSLRTLTQSSDSIIQVVRHDPNLAFPWAALYDFSLPERLVGAPPPPVCNGFIRTEQGEVPCGHGRRDQQYCVRGFWGVRHHIEQLIGITVEDAVREVSLPPGRPRVQLAVGTSDGFTKKLSEQLRQRFGSELREVSAEDDLLDLLWKEDQRPAEVILLGHLETRPLPSEPMGARLVLPSKDRWLRAKTLTDQIIDRRKWDTPRPVVFLMACSAAATQLATPNDLLMALTAAGAAAIIGTECVIFTGMAARFAEEITESLWQQRALGAAVTAFRRQLMREGNPLGFAFTVYGDAELIVKGES